MLGLELIYVSERGYRSYNNSDHISKTEVSALVVGIGG